MAASVAEDPAELRELVLRVARGDEDAEREVVRRFDRRVRLYAARQLGDREAARDMTQEVLAILLAKLRAGELRDEAKLGSFALGICRHLVANARAQAARRTRILARYPDLRHRAEVGHGGRVEEPELLGAERLRGCLMELSERERTIVLLTFYAERGAPEIAGELGATANGVRVTRHRALEKLRRCVGGET